MTPRFDATYGATMIEGSGLPWMPHELRDVPGYREFAHRYAGATFGGGLYRLHDARSGPVARALVDHAFPEHTQTAFPVGFDWLGRQYAVDVTRSPAQDSLLLLMDVGCGEVLKAPISFRELHEGDLVDEGDATLHRPLFEAWSRGYRGEVPLSHDRCAGYIVPMFRGGEHETANLAPIDITTYWDWFTRIDITRGLPLGITGLHAGEDRPA